MEIQFQLADLILAAIVVVSVVFAAKKGFAKSLLETASVVVSGVAAYHLCTPVADFVCTTFLTDIPYAVASVISRVVVFALLFVVLSIVLKLLSGLISSVVEKIPLVGTANTVLGGVLGFIKAAVIVYVICTVAYLFVMSDNAQSLKPIISNSYIYQFVTENNPVIDFIRIER